MERCMSYFVDLNAQPIAGMPVIGRMPQGCGMILENNVKQKDLPFVPQEKVNFNKDNYDKPIQSFRYNLEAPMIGLRPAYSVYNRC